MNTLNQITNLQLPVEILKTNISYQEKLVFTVIYNYCKRDGEFNNSYSFIADIVGCSIPHTCNLVSDLVSKKLLIKIDHTDTSSVNSYKLPDNLMDILESFFRQKEDKIKPNKKDLSDIINSQLQKWFSYVDSKNITIPEYKLSSSSFNIYPRCENGELEHRYLANVYLDDALQANNIVHHLDRNKANNDIHNLIVFVDEK